MRRAAEIKDELCGEHELLPKAEYEARRDVLFLEVLLDIRRLLDSIDIKRPRFWPVTLPSVHCPKVISGKIWEMLTRAARGEYITPCHQVPLTSLPKSCLPILNSAA